VKFVGITMRVLKELNYFERRDCIDQKWDWCLKQMGLIPVPLLNSYDISVVEELDRKLNFVGIILSGGNTLTSYNESEDSAPERDDFEKNCLDYAIYKSMPVIGVCRGLQLIVDYYGGNLTPCSGHVAKQHLIKGKLYLNGTEVESYVNSFHTLGITTSNISGDLIPFAFDEHGLVEGVHSQDKQILGIMWHPERNMALEELDKKIFYKTFKL
jgi:N5-(cytidine 5'-diphosphoramidyl)-L-glutamine hydrolase